MLVVFRGRGGLAAGGRIGRGLVPRRHPATGRIARRFVLGRFQSALLRLLDEELLRLEQRGLAVVVLLGKRAERRVAFIGQQFAQLRRVRHADVQVSQDLLAQLFVEHGPCDLDALVHVARHEVGARQVQLHVVARAEPVDAAVLEQASYDGHHAHVLGESLKSGHDARDAAHEQGDRNARLRRLDHLLDYVFVGDGVGLEEQAARLACASALHFPVDAGKDHRLDLQRGNPHDVVVVRRVLKRHVAEELGGVAAERLVGGDERQVGVELRRLLVVVAGAQLGDVLQAVLGLAGDAADLRVHLEVAEPVDHLASGLLEALRPLDVVALVEPGAQLEQRRHLLAVLGCRDERFRQVGLACQAVQRDLDGNDAWVVGGLAQKLHERVHRLVRVGQQHFLFGYLVDDRAVAVKASRPLRREGHVRHLGAFLLGQAAAQPPGEAHVKRHRRDECLVRFQSQALEQQLFQG